MKLFLQTNKLKTVDIWSYTIQLLNMVASYDCLINDHIPMTVILLIEWDQVFIN